MESTLLANSIPTTWMASERRKDLKSYYPAAKYTSRFIDHAYPNF